MPRRTPRCIRKATIAQAITERAQHLPLHAADVPEPDGAAPSEVARYSPMKKAPVSSPHCSPKEY